MAPAGRAAAQPRLDEPRISRASFRAPGKRIQQDARFGLFEHPTLKITQQPALFLHLLLVYYQSNLLTWNPTSNSVNSGHGHGAEPEGHPSGSRPARFRPMAEVGVDLAEERVLGGLLCCCCSLRLGY